MRQRPTEPWPAQRFELRPIQRHHGIQAGDYRQARCDPFDRLPAAQAELEGISLLSLDPTLQAFRCRLLW